MKTFIAYKKFTFIFLLSLGLKLQAWSFFGKPLEPIPFAQPIRFTLMLDPAGDARTAGRQIGEGFERELTYQIALTIKETLEAQGGIRVVLSKFAGEAITPLHIAAFTNKIGPNLFISVRLYETKDKTPKIHIFYPLYDSTALSDKKRTDLTLLPFDQGYTLSLKSSQNNARLFYDELKKEKKFACQMPLGLPYTPLIGIIAPAFGIEVGVTKKDDLQTLARLLATALTPLIIPEASHAA